jgi:hypothetical protein
MCAAFFLEGTGATAGAGAGAADTTGAGVDAGGGAITEGGGGTVGAGCCEPPHALKASEATQSETMEYTGFME